MRAAKAIPSAITITRILFFPYLASLVVRREFSLGAILFFIIAFTDLVDGWIARRWSLQTRFGAILDPIADKLLLVTIYLSLYSAAAIPFWLIAIVLGRDLAILAVAGGTMLFTSLRDFPPSKWGKVSTFIQVYNACATMIGLAGWLGDISWLVKTGWIVCGFWTAASGFHYLYLWKRRVWG